MPLDRHVDEDEHKNWYQEEEDRESGDTLLKNVCKAAHDQGIIIYVVAFDIADDEYDETRTDPLSFCASSPSHYHQAYGDQLVDDLFMIGSQITRLRLTN